MASRAAVLALTGFSYSGAAKAMTFAAIPGTHFWSNGYAWGDCELQQSNRVSQVRLTVHNGNLSLREFSLRRVGKMAFEQTPTLKSGAEILFTLTPGAAG